MHTIGASAVCEALIKEGVDVIFGHPGGAILPFYDSLWHYPQIRHVLVRHEQAAAHAAEAYARLTGNVGVCVATSGPGATNLITAAAGATINRIPVLLLPGDIFSTRLVAPVLQQLELPSSQDISVNDCFKPISKYWDRINRPEQIVTSLPEAMRILTSQAETGAVTLAMPQDVQSEAYDYPADLFEKRLHLIPRPQADRALLQKSIQWILPLQNLP